jgi:hypothetical protein
MRFILNNDLKQANALSLYSKCWPASEARVVLKQYSFLYAGGSESIVNTHSKLTIKTKELLICLLP